MAFIKKADFRLHPEGLFRARLIDLIEVPSLRVDWRPQFECTFLTEAKSPGGKQMQVSHYVTQFLSHRSKFGQMVAALGIGFDQIPDDQGLDTGDLLNRDCCLEIKHQVSQNGSKKAKVTSVLPFTAAETTQPPDTDGSDASEIEVPF